MTAWILVHSDGFPFDHNMFDLYVGFKELGEEVKTYSVADYVMNKIPISENDILVGHIDQCRSIFKKHGAHDLIHIDYPEELNNFLGRKIWKETLKEFHNRIIKDDYKPLFIKSVKQKQITGFVCKTFGDFIKISYLPDSTDIFVSETIDFISEFRVYIHKHEVVDCIRYRGEYSYAPNKEKIQEMLFSLRNANMPIAYSIDVGIVKEMPNELFLVECNDGFALGNYGLKPRLYAEMMRDRWYQIIRNKK